jgi:hypothetical protein
MAEHTGPIAASERLTAENLSGFSSNLRSLASAARLRDAQSIFTDADEMEAVADLLDLVPVVVAEERGKAAKLYAMGRIHKRDDILRWLRSLDWDSESASYAKAFADAIERGANLQAKEGE